MKPWRFILFIVVFGVFLAFITVNLDNRCDISFGFATIPNVPIFLTVFFSFVLGLLCTLPIVINAMKKRKDTEVKDSRGKKSLFFKKKGGPSDGGSNAAE